MFFLKTLREPAFITVFRVCHSLGAEQENDPSYIVVHNKSCKQIEILALGIRFCLNNSHSPSPLSMFSPFKPALDCDIYFLTVFT